jgi:hypothetical protein
VIAERGTSISQRLYRAPVRPQQRIASIFVNPFPGQATEADPAGEDGFVEKRTGLS